MSFGDLMELTPEDRERSLRANGVNDFTDIEFTHRVVASVVNAYSLMDSGTLKVNRMSDGDVRMTWQEAIDEGNRTTEATICRDLCDDTTESWQRDH